MATASPLLPAVTTPLAAQRSLNSLRSQEDNCSPASNASYGTEQYSPTDDSSLSTPKYSNLRESEEDSPDTVIVAFSPSPDRNKEEPTRTLNFNDPESHRTAKDWRKNGVLIPMEDGKTPLISSSNKTNKKDLDELPAFKSAIICVIPLFMGYACLFSLQGKIKDAYGITTHSAKFDQFGNAVSFLYMGNLVFRFAHNIFFFCFSPRIRVLIAMLCMVASLNLLLWGVFVCKLTHTLAWVYGAYGLGGVAVGSFEANLLSSITPLGHQTKLWATLGT
jgi:hypothetical protein|tara:strand:+ start:36 stop:866 length:831 start_codon:yes stop_codon:yes gene_type:complete